MDATGDPRHEDPDEDLVLAARRGEAAAFDRLVEAHKAGVYRAALRIVRDADLALDVVQDVFLRVFRALGGLEDPARFAGWLHTIAVRISLNHVSKRKAERSMTVRLPDTIEHAASTDSPSRTVENRELAQAIRTALDSLPEDQRIAVILCDLEGLSYDEIAQACEIPRGTVMSRIHYGRKKLREKLRSRLEIAPERPRS